MQFLWRCGYKGVIHTKCTKCGCYLPEDSEFCQYCGVRLDLQATAQSIPSVDPLPEIISEAASATTQTDASDNQLLMRRAYAAYTSTDPDEKIVFATLLGSEELKAAYLKECKRIQAEHDKGVHIDFKSTYLRFMEVLHDAYLSNSADSIVSAPTLNDIHKNTSVMTTKIPSKGGVYRYCELCGHPIDNASKKCTGCGKSYSKSAFKPLYALLIVLFLITGHILANYACAVSAMNDGKFIEAKRYFDNLLVSESFFPKKYSYIQSGVLMEEGKYVEALTAFNQLDGIPVPVAITDALKAEIYSAGQIAYRSGNMIAAKEYFDAIKNYKRSSDYLLLIKCTSLSGTSAKNNYSKLVKLLGFENTDKIILKNESTIELFLNGRWEDGAKNPYYFEMLETSDGWHTRYNLPNKDAKGYYYISDGIYYLGEADSSASKCFKFSIINEDTISVYCYKDGSTHELYKQ